LPYGHSAFGIINNGKEQFYNITGKLEDKGHKMVQKGKLYQSKFDDIPINIQQMGLYIEL
jgi:hypothetical protein